MASDRSIARAVPAAAVIAATLAGGCQLLSGLSGLHAGSGGAGGAANATSTAGSTGGGTASSVTTGASSNASSSSTTGATMASSSSGGCSCGGGPCSGNTCTPYVLVDSATSTPTSLASDGTYVYWTQDGLTDNPPSGSIWRQLIDGTDSPHPVASLVYPTHIVVDTASVYWSDQQLDPAFSGITRIASDGSGTATRLYATTQSAQPGALMLNGNRLSWDLPNLAQIAFGPITIGMPMTLDTMKTIGVFTADADSAFWADAQALWRQPFGSDPSDAGAAVQLLSANNIVNLVADAGGPTGSVYWSNASTLFQSPKMGGAPQVLVSTTDIGGLLVDDLHAYFTGSTDGKCTSSQALKKVPIAGGTPQMIKHLQGCAVLAQDAQNLLWIDGAQIWRVVKQ